MAEMKLQIRKRMKAVRKNSLWQETVTKIPPALESCSYWTVAERSSVMSMTAATREQGLGLGRTTVAEPRPELARTTPRTNKTVEVLEWGPMIDRMSPAALELVGPEPGLGSEILRNFEEPVQRLEPNFLRRFEEQARAPELKILHKIVELALVLDLNSQRNFVERVQGPGLELELEQGPRVGNKLSEELALPAGYTSIERLGLARPGMEPKAKSTRTVLLMTTRMPMRKRRDSRKNATLEMMRATKMNMMAATTEREQAPERGEKCSFEEQELALEPALASILAAKVPELAPGPGPEPANKLAARPGPGKTRAAGREPEKKQRAQEQEHCMTPESMMMIWSSEEAQLSELESTALRSLLSASCTSASIHPWQR